MYSFEREQAIEENLEAQEICARHRCRKTNGTEILERVFRRILFDNGWPEMVNWESRLLPWHKSKC